jgi:Flp pilus assembly pilin Flp
MKRRRNSKGQALIEYAFLMVLLATISFAVIILAGTQLQSAFSDITYEFSHLTDTSTLAPNGTTILPQAPHLPPAPVTPGSTPS